MPTAILLYTLRSWDPETLRPWDQWRLSHIKTMEPWRHLDHRYLSPWALIPWYPKNLRPWDLQTIWTLRSCKVPKVHLLGHLLRPFFAIVHLAIMPLVARGEESCYFGRRKFARHEGWVWVKCWETQVFHITTCVKVKRHNLSTTKGTNVQVDILCLRRVFFSSKLPLFLCFTSSSRKSLSVKLVCFGWKSCFG